MIANLTTPLIGIVSTTAIGRLGDATLLGGVAMASVLFDCLFWLFAFLRMSTVAFTAQSLGAGETRELSAILVRGFIVAALIGEEATVKTFKRGGGHVWLMPQNPSYEPIPGDDCQLMGKVVATVHRM